MNVNPLSLFYLFDSFFFLFFLFGDVEYKKNQGNRTSLRRSIKQIKEEAGDSGCGAESDAK